MSQEEMIKIGKIVSAVGIKGEVKIYSYSDRINRFEDDVPFYLLTPKTNKQITFDKIRYQKGLPIVTVSGCKTRDEAEKLIGGEIYVEEESLEELPEDTYYVRDLIGVSVYDETKGFIGQVKDVLQNSSQDIYVVKTEENKEVLIPAIREFVISVDLEKRRIDVKLIPGFLE